MNWLTRSLVAAALLTGCPAPDAPLPRSTSTRPIPPAQATLSLTADSVALDGGWRASGPADQTWPQAAEELRARRAAIESASRRDPAAPTFRGVLQLELPRDTTFEDLRSMLDAAATAGWSRPWLVVAGPDATRRGIALHIAELDAERVEQATKDKPDTDAGGYVNPRLQLDPARGYLLRAHDRVVDAGDGLVLPCSATPCADTWPHLELNRLARRIKLDHARDRAILLTAEPSVGLQHVVDALDHTRDDTPTARGARELFPVAIVRASDAS